MTMRTIVTLSLLVSVYVATGVSGLPIDTTDKLTVTLNVFSGSENPSWELTNAQSHAFRATLTNGCLPNLHAQYPSLGYQGFEVQTNGNTMNIVGCLETERFLLVTGETELPSQVTDYVSSVLTRLSLIQATNVTKTMPTEHTIKIATQDHSPIVGPDTPPVYDPKTDDNGDFISHCSMNNCYNYATDVATDTFAQPGRGSGKKWSVNTCENMNISAINDGLEWVGTELPTGEGKTGHYVALLIWPNTNFHWIRKDANGKWSHKPGGTPVKNTDDSGSAITDPSKSDFSPWTQFCGYMHVVPSTINIA